MLVSGEIFEIDILLMVFEMWDISDVVFYDGEEAIDWIDDVDAERFQGELPELVLLEIRLPGDIDGITVSQRLRKSPVLSNISIVLTTAYRFTPDEESDLIQQAGADLLLPKPFPVFKELKFILEEVIAGRS